MENYEFIKTYLPAVVVLIIYFTLRYFKNQKIKKLIPGLRKRDAQFVDVRTAGEFKNSNCPGTLNIPLDRITTEIGKLDKSKPVVLCCASGARSARAKAILDSLGFEAYNGGSWLNL